MKKIDKNSKLPLYHQLVEVLQKDIEEGVYPENEKIPSERELCDMYDLSRMTVRQAIAEMRNMGLIYKVHGTGTFVSPKMSQDLSKFYSFTDEMKKLGKNPWSKVLDFRVVFAGKKIARKLKCDKGVEVYEIVRLRMADDTPMLYERTYVPVDRFHSLSKQEVEQTPLYDIFRDRYGVIFNKAEEVLKPVATRQDEAELLETSQLMPSMMIQRSTYEKDHIIEYTITIARGDLFEYKVVLE